MEVVVERKIKDYQPIKLREQRDQGKKWKVLIIQAGLSKNNNFYSPKVLQESTELFEGVKVFAYEFQGKYFEHLPDELDNEKGFIRNLVGVLENCQFETLEEDEGVVEGITGELTILNDFYKKLFLNMWSEGKTNLVGFSAVMEAEVLEKQYGDSIVKEVEKIDRVESVDIVSSPAAGGKILKLIESMKGGKNMDRQKLIEEIKKIKPELFEGKDPESLTDDEIKDLLAEAVMQAYDKEEEEKKEKPVEESKETEKESKEDILILNKIAELISNRSYEEALRMLKEYIKAKSEISYGYPSPVSKESQDNPEIDNLKKEIEDLKKFKTRYIVEQLLNSSNLPEPVKDKIRKYFENKEATKEEIEKAIEIEKESLTKILESVGGKYMGLTGQEKAKIILDEYDKKQRALDLLVGYKPSEEERKLYEGISKYNSLRQAYEDITGDYGVTFDSVRINKLKESYPAGFTTANFPVLLQGAINKRLIKEYPSVPNQEWRKIVNVVPIKDFNVQKIVKWGSLNQLSTVAEGADYNEVTIGTGSIEEVASYSAQKTGVLVSVTREMILNDDIRFVSQIPKKIIKAAVKSLNQFVFDLLMNYGGSPAQINGGTIYDGKPLYHADHNNILNEALSYQSLQSAINMMWNQKLASVETGSSEYELLGIQAKYIVVPKNLENVAKALLLSDRVPGSANNDVNVLKGALEIIVSPYLRNDNDNWYLVADPNEYDIIEIGFVQGKEVPEVLVQEDPLTGYGFSADKITYKVRYEFGGAVVDYRPLVGSIVTS